MQEATNLQVEEYKYARDSIFKAERTMQAVFIFSIITSFSLFSALLTVVVKGEASDGNSAVLPWVFLTPMVIIIPLFEMIKGQRDRIIRDACYIIVFFEEVGVYGVRFCTRLNKLRENMDQVTDSPETGGPIPKTYFFVWTFSTVLFLYFIEIVAWRNGQPFSFVDVNFFKLLYLLVPAFVLGVLLRQKREFVQSMSTQKDLYIEQFRKVRDAENQLSEAS